MPQRTAVLLCLGLVASACDTTGPTIREKVPFRVLLESGHFFGDFVQPPNGDAEIVSPVSAVLTSRVEEVEFLDGYPRAPFWTDEGGPFYEPFPDVDYRTETAVVVALGTTGSGSVGVRVDSVVSDSRRATVYTTTVAPCRGTRDFVNPAVIVALEGDGRAVDFAETAVEHSECL